MRVSVNRESMFKAIMATAQETEPWNRPSPPWGPQAPVTDAMRDQYRESCKGRPIYSKVLLCVAPSAVELIGMDRDTCLTVSVPDCDVSEPGKCMVRPEVLGRILGNVPDKRISISMDADKLVFTCGRAQFEDDAGDPSKFLPAPAIAPTATCIVDAARLRRQIDLVAHAAATNHHATWTATSGVQFCLADPFLLCATNCSRMAWSEQSAGFTGIPSSPVIPRDSLRASYTLLDNVDGTATIQANANHLSITTSRGSLVTAQLNGRFPNCQPRINDSREGQVTVSSGKLLAALRQTGIMQPDAPQVIELAFKAASLELRAKSTIGRARAIIGALADVPHEMRVNGKDLVAVLQRLEKEQDVVIRYKDKIGSLLLDCGKELQFVSAAFADAKAGAA